jgi:hypothetical protein
MGLHAGACILRSISSDSKRMARARLTVTPHDGPPRGNQLAGEEGYGGLLALPGTAILFFFFLIRNLITNVGTETAALLAY